ncbi:hypothetical protein LWI28_026158 [Acer negundo]|uniref:Uncharacterized protein n=1 Tax=Acer negundo TaxID=4023 RepID=A0AAD5P4T9_ACENE|nr:hypothetical protein LWI28_026158 [Acer negundo]
MLCLYSMTNGLEVSHLCRISSLEEANSIVSLTNFEKDAMTIVAELRGWIIDFLVELPELPFFDFVEPDHNALVMMMPQHKDAFAEIVPSTVISNLFNKFSNQKLDSSSLALQPDLTRTVSNASAISPNGEIFPTVDNLPPNDNDDDTHSPPTSAVSFSTDPIMTFSLASFHPMITRSKNGIF